jgi:hypothetical protein
MPYLLVTYSDGPMSKIRVLVVGDVRDRDVDLLLAPALDRKVVDSNPPGEPTFYVSISSSGHNIRPSKGKVLSSNQASGKMIRGCRFVF